MNWLNLTDRCVEALLLAQAEARFLGDGQVGTEHMLIGLVVGGKTVGAQMLDENNIDAAAIRGYLTGLHRSIPSSADGRVLFSSRAETAVMLAMEAARQGQAAMVTTDHLFLGLLEQGDCTACNILRGLGLDTQPFIDKLRREANPRPRLVASNVAGHSVMAVLDALQNGLEAFLARLLARLAETEWEVRWPPLVREDEVMQTDADAYPISTLVDMILSRGIAARAEQILLEPQDSNLTIRYIYNGGSSDKVEAPKVFKDLLPFNVMRLARLNPMEKGRELQGQIVFAHRGRSHTLQVRSEPIHKGVRLCIEVLTRAA